MQGGAGRADGRRGRGFERTSALLSDRIRKAGESRGFAVARLLTHWAEIVGADLSALCRPQRLSWAREGMGATLTVEAAGTAAPLVQMRAEEIRARVNACYGYNAVGRVRIAQTTVAGFSGAAERFAAKPPAEPAAPPPEAARAVRAAVAPVGDAALRAALETLGRNLLARP